MKKIIPLAFIIALFSWAFTEKPVVKGYNSYVVLPVSDSNTTWVRGQGGEIIPGFHRNSWKPDSAVIVRMFKKLQKEMTLWWGDDQPALLPADDYDWQLVGCTLKNRRFIYLNGVAKSLSAPSTIPGWTTTAYETNHLDGGNLYCIAEYCVTDNELCGVSINAE